MSSTPTVGSGQGAQGAQGAEGAQGAQGAIGASTDPVVVEINPLLGKLLHKPDAYDGKDRNACSTFISQVNLYLSGSPAMFPNEQSKVLFAATYLRGKAFAWLEPRLLRGTDPMLSDFQRFCRELERNLGDPSREQTMAKRLRALKQGASAANYRSEFDSIAQYLTWDESALRSQYYEGLKADVKDALSYCADEPEDYKAYQDLTIRLDDRIYERKKESRTKEPARPHAPPGAATRKPSQAYTKQSTTYVAQRDDGPQPMDLDGTRSPSSSLLRTPRSSAAESTTSAFTVAGRATELAPARTKSPARAFKRRSCPRKLPLSQKTNKSGGRRAHCPRRFPMERTYTQHLCCHHFRDISVVAPCKSAGHSSATSPIKLRDRFHAGQHVRARGFRRNVKLPGCGFRESASLHSVAQGRTCSSLRH